MTTELKGETLFNSRVQDNMATTTNLIFRKWKTDPLNDELIDALNLAFELAHITDTNFYFHCRTDKGIIMVELQDAKHPLVPAATVLVEKERLVFFDNSGDEFLEIAAQDVGNLVYVPQNPGAYR